MAGAVYPCWKNEFTIGEAGGNSIPENVIANCLTFSVAINGNVEEWTAFENEGWKSRELTGKDIVLTVTAKRTVGDTGNDMVADCEFATLDNAKKDFAWMLLDGSKVWLKNAVVNVTNDGTGDATNVGELSFTVSSNGKPTFVPAA